MNHREAIARAEAWYLRRYHAVAHGHLPLNGDGRALDEEALLCIDLVPEREAAVVKVLLDLTGEEVAVLEEGVTCPRCLSSTKAARERWRGIRMLSLLRSWGKYRQHRA
jgi:hypothetical protein